MRHPVGAALGGYRGLDRVQRGQLRVAAVPEADAADPTTARAAHPVSVVHSREVAAYPQGSPQLFLFRPHRAGERMAGVTGLVSATTADEAVDVAAVDVAAMDPLDGQVLQLFSLVQDAVTRATEVFLATDRDAARTLVQNDRLIDALHDRTERAVLAELSSGSLDPGRQAWLLLVFRILPEL